MINTEFTGKTLDNFETPNPDLKLAKKTVSRYLNNLPENIFAGNGLLISGIVNSGKTHLAHAIKEECRKLINPKTKEHLEVCSVDYLDMIIFCKKAIGNRERDEWDVISGYSWKDILIIDDLAVDAKNNQWISELTYYLINHRYVYKKSTIVTTNHQDKEFIELFGFHGSRIWSRLERMNKEKPIWIGQRR